MPHVAGAIAELHGVEVGVAACSVPREGVAGGREEEEAVVDAAGGRVPREGVAGGTGETEADDVALGRVPREGVAIGSGEAEAEQEVCDLAVLDGNSRPPGELNPVAFAGPDEGEAGPDDGEAGAVQGDAVCTYDDVPGEVGAESVVSVVMVRVGP